jgi:hypothetical protein
MLDAPHLQAPVGQAGVAGPHHAPQPVTVRADAAIVQALREAAGIGPGRGEAT